MVVVAVVVVWSSPTSIIRSGSAGCAVAAVDHFEAFK